MIPSRNRLKRSDTAATQAAKRMRRIHGEHVSLLFAPLSSGRPKASVSVPAKIVRKASARNVLKRQCRAAVAEALRDRAEPFVYILQVKKGADALPFPELRREITALFDHMS